MEIVFFGCRIPSSYQYFSCNRKVAKMENTNVSWFTKIRQKFTFLFFLTTASIPLAFLGLIMLSSALGGNMFKGADTLGMDLFALFIFPLIAALLGSGFALLVAKLLTVPVVRWLVVFGLGIFAPLGAYLLALAGYWIARKLYLGDKADLPRLPFGAVEAKPNIVYVSVPAGK
jgi:hypothetical protein